MKIAVVHSFYRSSEPSGENAMVIAQANALGKAGNEVLLISKYTDEESDTSLYALRAAVAAAGMCGPSPGAEIAAFRPDVVHIHNLFPNFGTKWTNDTPVPIVATLHNYRAVCAAASLFREGRPCTDCLDIGSHMSVVHSCYRQSRTATAPLAWATRQGGRRNVVLQNCARIISLNPYATQIFAEIVGPERVIELPNFVEAPPVFPERESGDLGFLYVGRLTEEKGIRWLIDNWPQDEELAIGGAGPLEEYVRDAAGRNKNIQFRGKLNHDDAISLIAKAKAVIIPSMWLEGLPTVALEAFSAGTPIVISSRCGAADRLARDGAGLVFNPDLGYADLETALTEIQLDGATRKKAAFGMYRRNYSEDGWVNQMMELYTSVITEAKSKR